MLWSLIESRKWSDLLEQIKNHPEEAQTIGNRGSLPIHRACNLGTMVPLEVIEQLIDAYPQSLEHKAGKCAELPLHVAVSHEHNGLHMEIVKLLLRHYKEGAAVQDAHGQTPLTSHLFFYRHPNLQVIQMLVEAHPHAIQMIDIYQKCPLHYAARCDNWDICQYLIELYPEALQIKSKSGQLPREIANYHDMPEINQRLLQEEEKKVREVRDSSAVSAVTSIGATGPPSFGSHVPFSR